MKFKNLVLACSLFISAATIAQKDELKAAEKSMKAGNSAEAKDILTKAESLIANADNGQKAQFYFLKGNALLDLSKKKVDASQNLQDAATAYNELINVEKSSGKSKYSDQAKTALKELKTILTNDAVADNNEKRYKESAKKLYQVYMMDKKDTTMLYYAAGSALNGTDYDMALDYYSKLKDLNFSGIATIYSAKSKINDTEETFLTLAERDKAIKIGTHDTPKVERIPSKRGEIYKNIALIYIQKGNIPEAKKSISNARKTNPQDTSLILAEADLYLKTEDYETYKNLIMEVLTKNPNDADLFYNLGVISAKAKNGQADAERYYLKAIEIDPKYKNAYMNLAVLKLEGESKLVAEMNKLGTTPADNKKYDALKIKRQNLYKSAIPFLEKAYQLFDGDKDIKATLLNVYNALDMTDKYKALKAKN
jgi:tetratricopeptide (TPR) repeat protein